MEKHIYNEQTNIGYTLQGNYYLPDLAVYDKKEQYIGVWGQRHRRYLKEHHKVRYYNLLTDGTLDSYLVYIERQAEKLFEHTVKSLAEKENVTENLKVDVPMEWM